MKKLNQKTFCSWCGSKVAYTSDWASRCTNTLCGFRSYLNHKPCCSVIICKDDSVLMLKRSLEPQKDLYDFPGGFIDITDQSIEQATYRELQEELALTPQAVTDLHYIGSNVTPWDWDGVELKLLISHFTCNLLDESHLMLDTTENSELKWFTRKEFNKIPFAWRTDKEMLHKVWS